MTFAPADDAQHLDPIESLLDLNPKGRADSDSRREHRARDGALRLARSSGSPRPGSVGLGTGQLDVDPAGHGAQRYRRFVPIYALGEATPTIDPSAYVHPDAVIIGDVRIGPESSICRGPSCVEMTATSRSGVARAFRTTPFCTPPRPTRRWWATTA